MRERKRSGVNILSKKWLLAIPVFNEERYLVDVLRESRRYCDQIVIIDDGSTDATPDLLAAETASMTIRHPENRGYGASLASAFCYARREGFSWLITMDCDLQHEPSFIPAFMAAADRDEHDIISGTRYLPGSARVDTPPADRRMINGRITQLLNDRLGMNLTDAFCGFKAYRVSALRHFNVTIPGYAMPLQLWVQAWRAGLRISEVPVRLIYNDPNRHFGGMLDDPGSRYRHYLNVFESEMAAVTEDESLSVHCGISCA